MSFVSVYFFLFLAILLPLYWVLPHKGRIGLLLVASFVFYSFFDWRLSFLLLGYILVSYFVGIGLSKIKAKGGRIALLVVGIVAELSCLFVFKYANFAFSLAHDIFRMEGEALYWRIALPLGISFFTFQTIAYMVDVYRGEIEAERNFFYYALFVSFFPQLVAGPIESANHLLPQLKQKALAKGENFTLGIQYVLRGYMKKILIADLLGVFVDATFGGALEASGWTLLLATFAFGLQIYGDFSGYSDIALGIGRLLGIELMENFDRPYLSSGFGEFWRRWHISLNRFFVKYLYIPLGGSQRGRIRKYLAILLVFLCSGLWHGANLTFLLWGLFHGVLLIGEDLLSPLLEKGKESHPRLMKVVGIVFTYLIVNLLWVFFRAQSVGEAFLIYGRIFSSFAVGSSSFLLATPLYLPLALCAIAALCLLYYLPKISFRAEDFASSLRSSVIALAAVGVLVFVAGYVASLGGGGAFIYFQF